MITGLAKVATTGKYSDLSGKPSIPATPKAYVTETWKSGTSWYRKWSDGWIEQGTVATVSVWTGGSDGTVTLPKAFSNTNYSVVAIGEVGYGWANISINTDGKTTSKVTFHGTGASGNDWCKKVNLYACGY